MQTIDFKYQNYWLRIFSLIPMILLLAVIEYYIIFSLFENFNIFCYFAISILIMFIFVMAVYPHICKIFLKSAKAEFSDESITFFTKYTHKTIEIGSVSNIEINPIKLYGTKTAQMKLSFEYLGKKEKLVFYSEDLKDGQLKDCNLYLVYTNIVNIIK